MSRLHHLRGMAAPLLAVLDLVYPPQCAGCRQPMGESSDLLCAECWAAITASYSHRCPRCSCPLEQTEDEEGVSGGAGPCPNCASWEPVFDRLLVLGPFEGPMQQAVHALKFKQNRRLGFELGRRAALCEDLAGELSALQALIPVPLYPARERERGYNQSLLLARGMASVLDIPIQEKVLRRKRATRQQATLDAGERQDNLRGAFEVVGALLPGLRVGVVDDVVTTGATLNACAWALKEVGMRSVWGVAVASPFRQPG